MEKLTAVLMWFAGFAHALLICLRLLVPSAAFAVFLLALH